MNAEDARAKNDTLIQVTRIDYARREKMLDTLKPFLLVAAALPGAWLGMAALPLFLGAGVASLAAGVVVGGGIASLCAMGFIDKYSCQWGARALFLSGTQATRAVSRMEEEFRQTLPLKDDAKKAFIKAIAQGITEKLHIRRNPLKLKKLSNI